MPEPRGKPVKVDEVRSALWCVHAKSEPPPLARSCRRHNKTKLPSTQWLWCALEAARAPTVQARNILPDVRGHRVKDKDSEKSESVVVLGLEIAPARRGAALGLCLQHRQGRSPPGRPPILTAKWPCQVLPPAKSGELSGMLRRDSHLRVTKVVSLRREAGHIVCEPQGSHS